MPTSYHTLTNSYDFFFRKSVILLLRGDIMSTTIKEIRRKKGYSQEFIARKLNISLRHYQKIENGDTIPNVITGLKLALILGVDPLTLFLYNNKTKS